MRFPWFFVLFPTIFLTLWILIPASTFQTISTWLSLIFLAPLNPTFSGFSILVGKSSFQIVELCSGKLEIVLLLSAILATDTRSWENRFKYAFIFLPIALLFNAVRISITIYAATYLGYSIADLIHSILFRIFLFFLYCWLICPFPL